MSINISLIQHSVTSPGLHSVRVIYKSIAQSTELSLLQSDALDKDTRVNPHTLSVALRLSLRPYPSQQRAISTSTAQTKSGSPQIIKSNTNAEKGCSAAKSET